MTVRDAVVCGYVISGRTMSYEKNRGSARQRGYVPAWDVEAAAFKRRNPFCLGCRAVGIQTGTDVVDHVEPHKGDQTKFWNTALWQPACRWHHDVIKPQLERLFAAGEIGLDDLRLDSTRAIALTKRRPPRRPIGIDGWPA